MKLARGDYEERQRALTALYRKSWPRFNDSLLSLGPDRHFSKPHLIDLVAHGFPEADRKLFIVGQQTNGWDTDSPSGGDLIDDLLWLYKDFMMGARYVKSPFWVAAHQLYRCLNADGPADGFVWSNVLKVDEANVRPRPDMVDLLLHSFNPLPEELRLAHPDVVVFFTGPNYDMILERTFGGVIFHETQAAGRNILARLEYERDILPEHTYRIYHPKGLRLHKKWALIDAICAFVR